MHTRPIVWRIGGNSVDPSRAKRLSVRFASIVAGLWLSDLLLSGVLIGDYLSLLAASAVLGLVQLVLRPLAVALSFCLVILTFGLAIFVIDALMLLLASSVSSSLGLAFEVKGIGSALAAALIIGRLNQIGKTFLRPNRSTRHEPPKNERYI